MDRQPVFEFIHYPEFGEAERAVQLLFKSMLLPHTTR